MFSEGFPKKVLKVCCVHVFDSSNARYRKLLSSKIFQLLSFTFCSEISLWNFRLLHQLPFLSSSKQDWKLPDPPFTVCSCLLSTRDTRAHPVPRRPHHHLRAHLLPSASEWGAEDPEGCLRTVRLRGLHGSKTWMGTCSREAEGTKSPYCCWQIWAAIRKCNEKD